MKAFKQNVFKNVYMNRDVCVRVREKEVHRNRKSEKREANIWELAQSKGNHFFSFVQTPFSFLMQLFDATLQLLNFS